MRTSQKTSKPISTIGIDVGKNTFHLVGVDKPGAIRGLKLSTIRGALQRPEQVQQRAWTKLRPLNHLVDPHEEI